tara:strand:+ start:419 stop:706 length:288 start_codon:yes stop_codon:yes gene_type:complete
MAQVHKFTNSVILDADTASELWWCLNLLSDEHVIDGHLSEFKNIQKAGKHSMRILVSKMTQQGCQLSDKISNKADRDDFFAIQGLVNKTEELVNE